MKLEKLKLKLLGDKVNDYWNYREKYLNTSSSFFKLFYYFKLKRIENKTNSEFGVSYHEDSAVFLSRPILPHGLNGIIVSRKCKIGKNVTILHQVTIGTKITTEKSCNELDVLAPVIGDNVYIGAGAKIIGNITIGNNVLIGANAVVTKNVPDNCTAVGNPAVFFKTKNKYR